MPHKCSKCGEIVPCRKKYYLSDLGLIFLFFNPFKWICKKCDKAYKIMSIQENKKRKEQRDVVKESWIKQRDKLLMENEK